MVTHNDLSVSEGPVTHFTEIATNLQELGHEVVAFAPDLTGKRKEWSFHIRYLTTVVRRKGLEQLLYEFVLLGALWAYVRRERPDVIYSRQSYVTFAAPAVARLLSIPLATEVNGVLQDDLRGRGVGIARRWINKWCERYAYRRSDVVICVSEVIRSQIVKAFDLDPSLVHTLLNGVNVDHFAKQDSETRRLYRSRLGIGDTDFCVGYVGCFTPFDGIEQLADVAAGLGEDAMARRVVFVLIGSEEKKEYVERRIKENGVEQRFYFTGRVDYQELPRYMAAFDIGVAPYITANCPTSGKAKQIGNSSLKCLEYSALELPVLTTVLPQSDYVNRAKCGIVVEPDSVAALTKGIVALCGKGESELAQIGKRGRDYVYNHRSWRQVAEETVALMERCLAGER